MTLKTHHIDYKFNEGQIMQEIEQYVDKTYTSHYAQDVTKQATETIIDQGHGTGFCMGNIPVSYTHLTLPTSDLV